jgi:RHH-type transcriptional regulator, rel operon repressor / antitoxin RelB
MEKQTVTFRIDADKVSALDELAEAMDRDRTYLLNEAVAAYLELQQWQVDHIKASIKQADRGQFVSHEEVKKRAAKWRRRQ